MGPRHVLLLLCIALTGSLSGQTQSRREFQVRTLAFYNLENLFDTRNDSLTHDDDRTPEGADAWTPARLEKKLGNLARAISGIGSDIGVNPPDLIGVCEAENREVLEALLQQRALRSFPYGLIHYDSPDRRGIDVAFLYRKDRFFPEHSQSFRLLLYEESGKRKFTRDQLLIRGYLDTDLIYILINHWPSRGGGPVKSREHRKAAALLQRSIIDSILYRDPSAKIITMGDYNDNPTDSSIHILSGGRKTRLQNANAHLLNPFAKAYRRGWGSLAYRDRWNLFDQILFTGVWKDPGQNGYHFWKAGIYQPDYLKTASGRYKNYPFRTYAGGSYQGGYSDHFPVYAHLIRPKTTEVN